MIENPILSDELATGEPADLVSTAAVTLINFAYVMGVLIFFFMLILGGIQWLSSGGDKQKVANARSRLEHAVIGLVILIAAFAVTRIIENLFGISILVIDVGDISL